MKIILMLFFLLPIVANTQNLYSGKSDSKNDLIIQLNKDNTFILIESREDDFYDEFRGTVTQVSDSIFKLSGKRTFMQAGCRAHGDSLLYVHIDSSARLNIQKITLTYSNKTTNIFLDDLQETITVPLDHSLFNSTPKNNYFTINAGYQNPITKKEVHTVYHIQDEFCLEFYAQEELNLTVSITGKMLQYRETKFSDKTVLRIK